MEEIKVTFKTLTPLWTGDAWGENSEIKSSSIIGSLRFWFYIYCKIVAKEKCYPADDKPDKEELKNLQTSLLSGVIDNNISKDYHDVFDILKTILSKKLSLESQIFGCNGWKSQVVVKKIVSSEYSLYKKDIDFSAILDRLWKNSKFWANKTLFNNKDEVILFKDVHVNFGVSSIAYDEFVKFLKFYQGKIIVIGGKKSFGFGFCKIETDLEPSNSHVNVSSDENEIYDVIEINTSEFYDKQDKVVLGFNFKYYQRHKEDEKKYRNKNFGEIGKASNFFFSTKLKGQDKIYLIGFNDYDSKELFEKLLKKYSNFIEAG